MVVITQPQIDNLFKDNPNNLYETESGAIIGRGYLRPTIENISRQGGIVGPRARPSVGGKTQAQLNAETIARGAREREYARQAEIQAQKQAEINRQNQANLKQQQQAQQQQTIVTSRSPTLSTGGTPIRNVQLGKDVAEYQRRSFAEAKEKKRNLYLSEKDVIAIKVVQPKINITSTISTATEIIPGTTGESNVITNKGRIKEFFFGKTGEKFIGFGSSNLVGINNQIPLVTNREIKDTLQSKGLPSRTIAQFIPTTPGGVLIAGGTAATLTLSPPAVKIIADVTFGYLGTKQALDTSLPTEERIAGGIVGGLGFTGATFESLPFIKAGFSRLSTKFRPVKTESVTISKLFPSGKGNVISEISTLTPDETINVELIPSGKGFGFTTTEQKALLGTKRTITTSARDLFTSLDDSKVVPTEPVFFTPSLNAGNIAQARVSRLGLVDLFKFPSGNIQMGFTKQNPQIVFARNQVIKNVGFASGELETTSSSTLVGNLVARTSIKGQAVNIFEAVLSGGTSGTIPIPGISTGGTGVFVSTTTLTTGSLTTGLINQNSNVVTTSTTPTLTSTTLTNIKTTPTIPKGFFTTPTIPKKIPTRPIITTTRPTESTITLNRLTSIPTKPIITPTFTITRPPRTPRIPPIIPGIPKLNKVFAGKGFKQPKQRKGRYPVYVRRFGKWKSIGFGATPQKAIFKGKRYSKRTLGRSFYIPGVKPIKIKGFRTKKEKIGNIFIQKTGKGLFSTLGSGGEKREIKMFRNLIPNKKKRRKKKK